MDEGRYSRNEALFGPEGQARIGGTSVMIVGLGGLGSAVAQQLAYLGVRRFLLIDADVVSLSNMNRLIGAHEADVDVTPKVAVAERIISAIQPTADVTATQAAFGPATASLAADVQTKEVTYKQGDTELTGFFAWDAQAKGRQPGVVVVHEWWGHNEHARNQAKRLAQAGYVGFALDMYGKGKVTTHPKDAQAFMEAATKDPAVVKARFEAALAELRKDPHVDPEKTAAIGYCFGGAIVLSMARMGVNLDAVLQEPGYPKDSLPFVITVEPCEEAALGQALTQLSALDWHAEEPLALPMLVGEYP